MATSRPSPFQLARSLKLFRGDAPVAEGKDAAYALVGRLRYGGEVVDVMALKTDAAFAIHIAHEYGLLPSFESHAGTSASGVSSQSIALTAGELHVDGLAGCSGHSC